MADPSAKAGLKRAPSRRAAIYVRMSSRPQDHSIQHQCDRLDEYAEKSDIDTLMMYADAGKSGLRINALQVKGIPTRLSSSSTVCMPRVGRIKSGRRRPTQP